MLDADHLCSQLIDVTEDAHGSDAIRFHRWLQKNMPIRADAAGFFPFQMKNNIVAT